MKSKTIIQFIKTNEAIEFKTDDMTLMDLIISMSKLKVLLFEELDRLDLLDDVDFDIDTYEGKIMFMTKMLESVEKNNLWEEELLN